MEPNVLDPVDQPSIDEPKPNSPNRVQALIGITCALAVAAGLGLPGIDASTSIQILLTVVGFRLARVVHRCSSETDWRVPMVLGLAARAMPTVLSMIALVVAHQLVTGRGLSAETATALAGAATFTADIIPFATGAGFAAVDHLWAVALVAQVAVAAPWLLTARRQQLGPRRRALLLLGAAGLTMVARMVFLAIDGGGSNTPGAEAWLTPPDPSPIGAVAAWTSLDALLLGLAIGTLPLANLHRHPTTRLVTPAVCGLALLLILPAGGPPVIDTGLRMALGSALAGVVLAAEAISGLPAWLSSTLTNAWWHRLGSRSFGLYLWHIPFAYGITGADPFEWQGVSVFALVIALTLAAATTTYRSIEIPAQIALASLVARWYRPDAVLLPSPEPQRGKWIRWDDVSLDRLPLPARRRTRVPGEGRDQTSKEDEPLGRRLWQLGDRQIDLRPGRKDDRPPAPVSHRPADELETDQASDTPMDRPAAAG